MTSMTLPSSYIRRVVPQDCVNPETRLIIDNIPLGVTEDKLRLHMGHRGSVHFHAFVAATPKHNGWAWVSFDKHETRQQVIDEAIVTSQSRNGITTILNNQKKTEEEKKMMDSAATTDTTTPNTSDLTSSSDMDSSNPDSSNPTLSSGDTSRDEPQPLIPQEE